MGNRPTLVKTENLPPIFSGISKICQLLDSAKFLKNPFLPVIAVKYLFIFIFLLYFLFIKLIIIFKVALISIVFPDF